MLRWKTLEGGTVFRGYATLAAHVTHFGKIVFGEKSSVKWLRRSMTDSIFLFI